MEKQIDSLLQKREVARGAAFKHSSTAKIEALTQEAIALTHRGKDASTIFAERDALKDARDAEVRAISEELSQVRRAHHVELASKAAAELEKYSVEDLEALRAELTADRKALKKKMRACSVALAKKQAVATMKALWATLSSEERAALLASINEEE